MKVHVHWMNLMTNQIIQKCENFERKGCKVKESFNKKKCSMRSKCLALGVGHMYKN
jgi:hypothetical protein